MHCRNCGSEVDARAVACPACGVPPRLETKFCSNCGAPTTANQTVCTKCGVALGATAKGEKSKIAAGLFGIFLGAIGIHKFYLGYTKQGVIMLLIAVIGSLITFGGAASLMALFGFIEGIIYLTKSDEQFAATYVQGRRPWF